MMTKELKVQLSSLEPDLVSSVWDSARHLQVQLFAFADDWAATEERVVEWSPQGFSSKPEKDVWLSGYIPLSAHNLDEFSSDETAVMEILGLPGDQVIYRLNPPRSLDMFDIWVSESDIAAVRRVVLPRSAPTAAFTVPFGGSIKPTGDGGVPPSFVELLEWARGHVRSRMKERPRPIREDLKQEIEERARKLQVPSPAVAANLVWLWTNPNSAGGRREKFF